MPNEMLAVKPETLLVDLPPVPDWFRQELSRVGTKEGKPMFRIVDGQRELKWRNGKMDIKHLLQHDSVPAYVPVVRQLFRRKDTATGDYVLYTSRQQAEADTKATLEKEVDFTNMVQVRAVGRSCWIIEAYISPDEVGHAAWDQCRYADLQTNGVVRRVDVLGPFPREGMYVYCFSVLDEDGKAIAPNQRTLEECKRRWQVINSPQQSVEQAVRDYEDRQAKFEANEVKRIADNIYQYHGISAKRWHYGEISKPIKQVYGNK